jgi:hypothetical protein
LLCPGGCAGIIATNTIYQADTRVLGLSQIRAKNGVIYRAIKRLPWPGQASVVVSVIHFQKAPANPRAYVLNGIEVECISSYLYPSSSDDEPKSLSVNRGKSFRGCDVFGIGFVFDNQDRGANSLETMNALIESRPSNHDRIFPYIGGGKEFNSNPTLKPTRFIIDFGEMTLEEASHWPELLGIVKTKVKPARATVAQKDRRELWWLYATRSPGYRLYMKTHSRCLAIARVSDTFAFGFVEGEPVVGNKLVTFAFDSYWEFSIMQSRFHETWVRHLSATMKDDLQYSSSDCFDTFPFPGQSGKESQPTVEEAGQAFYEARASEMIKHGEGLTLIHNRFNDPGDNSSGVEELRGLYRTMNASVRQAYRWGDLDDRLGFGLDYLDTDEDVQLPDELQERIESGDLFFWEANEACAFQGQLQAITGSRRKLPWRYRWPDAVRDEVLARLLALNAKRYAEEANLGLHTGGRSRASANGSAAPAGRGKQRGRPPKAAPAADSGQIGLAF